MESLRKRQEILRIGDESEKKWRPGSKRASRCFVVVVVVVFLLMYKWPIRLLIYFLASIKLWAI